MTAGVNLVWLSQQFIHHHLCRLQMSAVAASLQMQNQGKMYLAQLPSTANFQTALLGACPLGHIIYNQLVSTFPAR